jgi:hypothetical protein
VRSKTRSAKQIELRIQWIIADLSKAAAIAPDRLQRLAEWESDGLARHGEPGPHAPGSISDRTGSAAVNATTKPNVDNLRSRLERDLRRLHAEVNNLVAELDGLAPAAHVVSRGAFVRCANHHGCDNLATYFVKDKRERRCATCYQYRARNNGKDRQGRR